MIYGKTLEPKLEEFRRLKQRGRASRNLGEFSQAIQMFDRAIDGLRSLQRDMVLAPDELKEVRAELADTFGAKGGTYRRWDDLPNHYDLALEQYKAGYEIEKMDKLSTYNASNLITLQIAHENRPLDSSLLGDIDRIIGILKADTAGARADEFWAWSDLAQFQLLRNDLDGARESYKRALETGPSYKELERHLQILHGLIDGAAESAPDVSRTIRLMVEELQRRLIRTAL